MHFRVAMAPSLVSSQARTALPTPTPPTSSAVRPTRLRKEPSRSTMRRTWGAGVLEGAHLPSRVPQRLADLRLHRVRADAFLQAQRVLVVDEAAFAQELRGGERVEAHQDPGPESEGSTGARAVGLALDRPPHFERDAADGERIPFLEIEAIDERGIDERAPRPAGPRQRRRKRNRRAVIPPRLDAAEQGIAAVHRLELDEHARLGVVRKTRHGAHLREMVVAAAVRSISARWSGARSR